MKRVTTKVITMGTLAAVVLISTTAWAITSKVKESAKNKLYIVSEVNTAAVDKETLITNENNEDLASDKDKEEVDLLASNKVKQDEIAKQTEATRLAKMASNKTKESDTLVNQKKMQANQSEVLSKQAEDRRLAAIAENRAEVDRIVTGWADASKAAKIASDKAERVKAANQAKIKAANLAKEKADFEAKKEEYILAKIKADMESKIEADRLAKIEKDKQDQLDNGN